MAAHPEQKLAVVTGASAGIGRALALLLSAEGRPVLAIARRAERLVDLQLEAEARGGGKIHMFPQDLAAEHAAERIAVRARELGPPTLLVNNAGFGLYGRFAANDPRRLGQMLRINCDALVLLTHALLHDLAATGEGMVLNVASAGGFQPMPFMAVYGATKAFVVAFTEAMAAEQTPGVRFAALCPGPVETEFGLVAGTGGRFNRVPGIIGAEQAARAALDLVHGGGVLSVPGLLNKLAIFASRHFPRAVVRHFAARLLRPRESSR